MKTLYLAVLFSAISPLALAESPAKQAEAYYQKGLVAEKAGKPDTARAAYLAALELHPEHANARYRAGQMKIHAASIKSAASEAKIGAVVIPVYKLDEDSLQDAIDLLSIAMEKQTDGKIVPNFIIEDPKNRLADAKVTMNLKNIPVKAILQYLHSQTQTTARYDEHAVVIVAR
jgi:tetratricopeptide (TPR) repeat protein